jgi:hypothetical protein
MEKNQADNLLLSVKSTNFARKISPRKVLKIS